LSSPLTPSVIAAPAVGVVIFKTGNNRCRGIFGLSNCACVVIGCDVVPEGGLPSTSGKQ